MTHPFDPYRIGPARILACLGTIASLVSAADPTLAQDADSVTIDARRCIEIESRDERLACFEAQVDDALERDGASAPAAPPAASTPGQAPQHATRTVEVAVPREQGRNAEEPTEWIGSIRSLTERQPNRYLITLDSGEMWLQKVAERYPMRVGQRVRIYATRWGSSQRLEADGLNGFIQVERVR